MELKSSLSYKGYTIKTFSMSGKDVIKIYLAEELVDYDPETEEHYEGSDYEKKGVDAARQYIDELEEKENSL